MVSTGAVKLADANIHYSREPRRRLLPDARPLYNLCGDIGMDVNHSTQTPRYTNGHITTIGGYGSPPHRNGNGKDTGSCGIGWVTGVERFDAGRKLKWGKSFTDKY